MAKDPGIGYRVVGTITGVKGKCDAAHQVGENFEISCHNPGGLCGFFYHDLFPNLMTFQFGEISPGGKATPFNCNAPIRTTS